MKEGLIINSEIKSLGGFISTGAYVQITMCQHNRSSNQLFMQAQVYKSEADYKAGEAAIQVVSPAIEQGKYFQNVKREDVTADLYYVAEDCYIAYLKESGVLATLNRAI